MSERGYTDKFLSLRCAPDVLSVVGPMDKAGKEISEAMAIIRRVRGIVLAPENKMRYTLVDLCSGNALVPVIAAHLLPVRWSYAVDARPRVRAWERAARFTYLVADVYSEALGDHLRSLGPLILTACHPCGELAERVIELYRAYADHLVLMPCCEGPIPPGEPAIIREKMGAYLAWCVHLAGRCGGQVAVDEGVLSPKNALVTAHKEAA